MRNRPSNFLYCIQGSAEWFDARVGLVTASHVADAINLKSVKRDKYKMELLAELLTGKPVEHYVSPAMDWGIQNEAIARSAYELQKGVEVELVGFVIHPQISRSGASPDGLVGEDGLVEIKCPNTTTHLRYLVDGVVPEEYQPQMMWQMACTSAQWCDFVSYDPRLPEEFALFIVRLERNERAIMEMECGVKAFISEVNVMAGEMLKRKDAAEYKRVVQPAETRDDLPGPPHAIIPEMA